MSTIGRYLASPPPLVVRPRMPAPAATAPAASAAPAVEPAAAVTATPPGVATLLGSALSEAAARLDALEAENARLKETLAARLEVENGALRSALNLPASPRAPSMPLPTLELVGRPVDAATPAPAAAATTTAPPSPSTAPVAAALSGGSPSPAKEVLAALSALTAALSDRRTKERAAAAGRERRTAASPMVWAPPSEQPLHSLVSSTHPAHQPPPSQPLWATSLHGADDDDGGGALALVAAAQRDSVHNAASAWPGLQQQQQHAPASPELQPPRQRGRAGVGTTQRTSPAVLAEGASQHAPRGVPVRQQPDSPSIILSAAPAALGAATRNRSPQSDDVAAMAASLSARSGPRSLSSASSSPRAHAARGFGSSSPTRRHAPARQRAVSAAPPAVLVAAPASSPRVHSRVSSSSASPPRAALVPTAHAQPWMAPNARQRQRQQTPVSSVSRARRPLRRDGSEGPGGADDGHGGAAAQQDDDTATLLQLHPPGSGFMSAVTRKRLASRRRASSPAASPLQPAGGLSVDVSPRVDREPTSTAAAGVDELPVLTGILPGLQSPPTSGASSPAGSPLMAPASSPPALIPKLHLAAPSDDALAPVQQQHINSAVLQSPLASGRNVPSARASGGPVAGGASWAPLSPEICAILRRTATGVDVSQPAAPVTAPSLVMGSDAAPAPAPAAARAGVDASASAVDAATVAPMPSIAQLFGSPSAPVLQAAARVTSAHRALAAAAAAAEAAAVAHAASVDAAATAASSQQQQLLPASSSPRSIAGAAPTRTPHTAMSLLISPVHSFGDAALDEGHQAHDAAAARTYSASTAVEAASDVGRAAAASPEGVVVRQSAAAVAHGATSVARSSGPPPSSITSSRSFGGQRYRALLESLGLAASSQASHSAPLDAGLASTSPSAPAPHVPASAQSFGSVLRAADATAATRTAAAVEGTVPSTAPTAASRPVAVASSYDVASPLPSQPPRIVEPVKHGGFVPASASSFHEAIRPIRALLDDTHARLAGGALNAAAGGGGKETPAQQLARTAVRWAPASTIGSGAAAAHAWSPPAAATLPVQPLRARLSPLAQLLAEAPSPPPPPPPPEDGGWPPLGGTPASAAGPAAPSFSSSSSSPSWQPTLLQRSLLMRGQGAPLSPHAHQPASLLTRAPAVAAPPGAGGMPSSFTTAPVLSSPPQMRTLPPPVFVAIRGGVGSGSLPSDLAAAASAEVAAALASAMGSGGGQLGSPKSLASHVQQPASAALASPPAPKPRFRLLDLSLPTEGLAGDASAHGAGDALGFPDGVTLKPRSSPSKAPLNASAAAASGAARPPVSWAGVDRERRLRQCLDLLEAPVH